MSARNDSRLRHIAYAYPDGTGFGDHYITQDPALGTADQFDVTVFPYGDDRLPHSDPLHTVPHVRIQTWDGQDWQVVSRTPIEKG
jgi:hypothetical protein